MDGNPSYRISWFGRPSNLTSKVRKFVTLTTDSVGSKDANVCTWILEHPGETIWLVGTRILFIVELPEIGLVAVILWGAYKMKLLELFTGLFNDGGQKLKIIQEQNSTLLLQNAALQEEVRVTREENWHLREENGELTQDVECLHRQLADSLETNHALRQDLAESQRTNQELREDQAASRKRIATLETTVKTMQWQLAEIQESLRMSGNTSHL